MLVVDIEELGHQFGGGVFKNSISIKRFKSYYGPGPKRPSHLLLMSVKPAPESYEPDLEGHDFICIKLSAYMGNAWV